jgi:hypothetical protein
MVYDIGQERELKTLQLSLCECECVCSVSLACRTPVMYACTVWLTPLFFSGDQERCIRITANALGCQRARGT